MTKTKTKTGTWLPIFSGFYDNSLYEIDDYQIACDLKNQGLTDIEIREFFSTDLYYSLDNDYKNEICIASVEAIENILTGLGFNLSIEYDTLVSPKYYNYNNDSININIDFDEVELKNKITTYLQNNYKKWEQFLSKCYTSYSGFISNYDNNATSDDWSIDNIINGSHQLGKFFEFVLLNEKYTEFELFNNVQVYFCPPSVEAIRHELNKNCFYDDVEVLADIWGNLDQDTKMFFIDDLNIDFVNDKKIQAELIKIKKIKELKKYNLPLKFV